MLKSVLCTSVVVAAGLCSAATYYKVGGDAGGTSSFAGNVSSSVGWSTTSGATSTSTVSDFANSDFIVSGNVILRIPATDADIAFGGRSLTLTNGGGLTLKKNVNDGNRNVTINDLRVVGAGSINMAQDLSQFTLKGAVTVAPEAALTFSFGLSTSAADKRALVMDAAITGDETTSLVISGSGTTAQTQSSPLTLNNVGNFLGTIKASGSPRQPSLVVNGAYGGTLTDLPAETTVAWFDYDGLPAATGLRIATTTPSTVLKTKLRFFADETDLFEGGHAILTFPAGTEVDLSEFTLLAADSPNGATKQLYLEQVTNDDQTVSFVTKAGRTFYKVGYDAASTSSFSTNVSASVGWSTTRGSATTTPFSALEMTASDFIIENQGVRTPESGTSWTFSGHSLRIVGNDSINSVMLKCANNGTITFPKLTVDHAIIFHGVADYTYTLAGDITIVSGSTLTFIAADTKTRTTIVKAPIHGDPATFIRISSVNPGTEKHTFNDLGDFFGTFEDVASGAASSSIVFAGAFSGTVGTLSAKAALTVNYDGLPAGKGLKANQITDSLKKIKFYSATTDFNLDNLPLIVFPAGTVVDPAAFTLTYATSVDAAGLPFRALKTFTADDNSVVLAVDASQPLYAKFLDDGTGMFSWHFYGSEWNEVTTTCGLTEPNNAITVCFESSAQYEAIKAHPCTARDYRMMAFSVEEDVDLTSAGWVFTADPGVKIDIKGHKVLFPPSFFSGYSTTSQQLLKNTGFEAQSIDSGAYVVVKPTDWSTSGTVALLKNNDTYANSQRDGSNWCFIHSGASISQAFTMPEAGFCYLSFKIGTKNNTGVQWVSNGNVKIDGAEVLSWSGQNNLTATRSAYAYVGAGGHTIQISCTYNSGMSVDNMSLTLLPSRATITDTVGGGEVQVDVPSGASAANTAVALTGGLKFVKKGEGVFTMSRMGQTYTGGTEVLGGKLITAAGSGGNADNSAQRQFMGAKGSEITVQPGGTFDIAGNYDYYLYHIVLNGGTFRSGSATDGPVPQSQTAWGGVGWLTLTADSTFYLRSDVVFNSKGDQPIDLGGHVLTIDAPIDSKYIPWQKDITNGTVRLLGVSTAKEYFRVMSRTVEARTVDFIDRMGLNMETNMNVRGYNPTLTWNNALCTGTAALNVYGTFRPDSDYFYGCTLQDGATLDLSGKEEMWSTTSAATVGRKTVDFAPHARITVKLEGRTHLSGKIVDWTDHVPENYDTIEFVLDSATRAQGYNIYKIPTGILLECGTTIFIR